MNQQLSQSNVSNSSSSSSSTNIEILSRDLAETELIEFLVETELIEFLVETELFEFLVDAAAAGFATIGLEAVGALGAVAMISISGDELFPT